MNAACFLCAGTRYRLLSDCARFGAPGRFWLCEGCGLIHQDPEFSANWKADLYDSGKYFEANAPEDPAKLLSKRWAQGEERARWIESYVGAGRPRILEIGSAEGAFLSACKARGWAVEGVEPDPKMSAFTREKLTISTATSGWEGFRGGPFDVVASFHVIEHVPQPAAFVKAMDALLSPSGILYLETPDNLTPWTHRPKWYDWFDSGHVCTFHAGALMRLLDGFGGGKWEIVDGAVRLAVRRGGAPAQATLGEADRIAAAFESFKRHHWWKRWFQRAGRKLRRLLG